MDTAETAKRDIVVIGASSGGVDALMRLVARLPAGLPAAVYVVQHVSASSPGLLARILERAGPLPAKMAASAEPLAFGEIRVAPPDHHLVLDEHGSHLDRGPAENRVRPAVDVLFRSAAVAFGPRVIGVVLTGNLSDGAAGLHAIELCGGLALVQSPDDALFPDMPRNAIEKDDPDVVLPLDALADEIAKRVGEPVATSAPIVPEHVELEAPAGYRLGAASVGANDRLGSSAPFVCSECGGPLWEVAHEPLHFRCAIGHAMAGDALVGGKSSEIARALGIAMRSLDEKSRLLERMAIGHREANRHTTAEICERKRVEASDAAELVRRLVASIAGTVDE